MTRRTILFIIGGLLLAGIIHIVAVMMVPYYATNDAWSKIRTFGRDRVFHVLPPAVSGDEPLASPDPYMIYAVCRFSMDDGPVRITADLPDRFWSIAVFDRRGRNRFSLNDRSAERTELDVAVITPIQMAQLRQDPPEALETAIVLEVPIEEGFAMIRLFVSDNSVLPRANEALELAACDEEL